MDCYDGLVCVCVRAKWPEELGRKSKHFRDLGRSLGLVQPMRGLAMHCCHGHGPSASCVCVCGRLCERVKWPEECGRESNIRGALRSAEGARAHHRIGCWGIQRSK